MKPISESKMSEAVRDYFLSLSPFVKAIRKDQSQYSGQTGTSDWLVCVNGTFVAIELKTGKNKPTKKQEIFLREIQRAGGVAEVCRSLEEVKTVIRKILEPYKFLTGEV